MDTRIEALAGDILDRAAKDDMRYLVGVSGIPGSGKSTIAYPLVIAINRLSKRRYGHQLEIATCVGVDGWHLSRAQLSAMPDSEQLVARRGAHFTFDGSSYSDFVKVLRSTRDADVIPFPTFSHAKKDPEHDSGAIQAHHRIVVIEGLYCFLSIAPWHEAAQLLNERIWVDCPTEVARARLIQRHLIEGVESSLEAASKRVEQSDLLNGTFVRENALTPTLVIAYESAPSSGPGEHASGASTYTAPTVEVA